MEKETANFILNVTSERAKNFGWKGKKKIVMQYEFCLGAIAMLDQIRNDGKTCIPPAWYVSIMRGLELKPLL